MLTYLALGDSYTIGELVSMEQNFPFQTVQLLRAKGIDIADPVIIATTGWTTDELAAAIRERNIQETFSWVTLLIGVNNQYRGKSLENYKEEFTSLLNQAISFAAGNAQHVIVLSIPDWGVTPFAHDRNSEQIAKEIDAYNQAKEKITLAHGCQFIEITESTRTNGTNPEFLTEDGLHPSVKEYAVWAGRVSKCILFEK
jgi:lysophospholipase L1-like esterase